jgi:hypothetical protein
MSRKTIAIYRFPLSTAAQVGSIEVIFDRTGRGHIKGIKVVTATPSGEFVTITTAKGTIYHVKAEAYRP